ncbi:hypothetical protein PM082_014559 [Marasmius tenuissimus]|nr:hypothetical protein PM082_014559 [Marasmius tenuissimus]
MERGASAFAVLSERGSFSKTDSPVSFNSAGSGGGDISHHFLNIPYHSATPMLFNNRIFSVFVSLFLPITDIDETSSRTFCSTLIPEIGPSAHRLLPLKDRPTGDI